MGEPTVADDVTTTNLLPLTPAEVEQIEAALTADPKAVPELARLIREVGSTPTGVPIIECGECGHTHPATRRHCPTCGLATLFGHQNCRTDRG